MKMTLASRKPAVRHLPGIVTGVESGLWVNEVIDQYHELNKPGKTITNNKP